MKYICLNKQLLLSYYSGSAASISLPFLPLDFECFVPAANFFCPSLVLAILP